jgi:hypothetical protein
MKKFSQEKLAKERYYCKRWFPSEFIFPVQSRDSFRTQFHYRSVQRLYILKAQRVNFHLDTNT